VVKNSLGEVIVLDDSEAVEFWMIIGPSMKVIEMHLMPRLARRSCVVSV
jgi:hypothetical protein